MFQIESKYYTVEITETLQRCTKIKAVSTEEIILDADDCVDRKIEIAKV